MLHEAVEEIPSQLTHISMMLTAPLHGSTTVSKQISEEAHKLSSITSIVAVQAKIKYRISEAAQHSITQISHTQELEMDGNMEGQPNSAPVESNTTALARYKPCKM